MRSKRGHAPLLFIPLSALMLLAFLTSAPLHGQEKKDTLTFRIMGYNVENLFDCRHDTLKNDREFLPDAVRRWNYTKYKKKLNAIARVIIAAGKWTPPALVALCEVENDSVLRDLTRYSVLREAGYRYVITHSPDERGINVALLYQRGIFKLLSNRSYPVMKPRRNNRPTRDILHVSGQLLNSDILDVFVVHFPSRSGGAKASEPYRLAAAQRLKDTTDSLLRIRTRPQIIIMGDFNDYPDNKSIRKILKAGIPPTETDSLDSRTLYHLLARKGIDNKHFGSYKYQGGMGTARPYHSFRQPADARFSLIHRRGESRCVPCSFPSDRRPEIRRRTTLPHLLRHEISRGIQRPPARMGGIPSTVLIGILVEL